MHFSPTLLGTVSKLFHRAFSLVHYDVIKSSLVRVHLSLLSVCVLPPPRLLGTVSKLFYIRRFHWFMVVSQRVSLVRVHLFLLSISVLLPRMLGAVSKLFHKAFALARSDVVGSFVGSGSSVSVVHLCTSTPGC